MDKKNSTAADKASTISKDAVPNRRANIKMVQNVLLVWLDNNMDDNSTDCRNTVTQLRRVINAVNMFTDGDQCIEFISNMNEDKACMIISGSLGQHIVPRVHNMFQLDSIFIFCGNKQRHEQWAKDWSKVKGIFTEIGPICDALKKAAQQCEQNSIAISFMATNGDISTKKLDQLDCSFMYTQIMKEILLSITFEPSHIQEFIAYCRDAFADNPRELNKLKELEQTYHEKTPIWWYTCEGFLYPMLNRALRLMDVDIIIKIGFFIGDLHRHIAQLHGDQYNGHHSDAMFTAYRGQGMSKTDFEQLTKIKGGLMSFNNFLSTSTDRNVSLRFARSALTNLDLMGILFVMAVDPSISTTPFASITDASCFKTENEILFSMHTVFRIRDIKPMDENSRLVQVDLVLTTDNDQDLRAVTDRVRQETEGSTGWYRLGGLLRKMGQFNKAEQVYAVLLEKATDDTEKLMIYNQLGLAKDDQGAYKEAIAFYEQSLQIKQKILLANHPGLAVSYNNIGEVYRKIGEYSKALSYYEKTLEIQKKTLPPNHPDLAGSYNNIGIVCRNMKEYSKALSYYEKALEIRQNTLPSNHPDLGTSYNNIGNVCANMGEYPRALSYYEKALKIRQKTLPPNHPDLGVSYNSIGNVYGSMREHPKALSYFEKALEISQKTLPPNHPTLGSSYSNIGTVYELMGDYTKARSFYERAVDNAQHSLPPNHPHLQMYIKNFDRINKKL